MSDTTTVTLTNLSARVLGRVLRDSRIEPIAIEYYATEALEELLRQLPVLFHPAQDVKDK